MTRLAMLLVLTAACLDVEAPDAGSGDEARSDQGDDVVRSGDAVDELEIDEGIEAPPTSDTDDVGPGWVLYPSTYTSNCTCSFCTAYCVVNGTTVKNGSCC